MKNFLIVGLGRFGTALAQELCEQGHEVLAVDILPERVQAFGHMTRQEAEVPAPVRDRWQRPSWRSAFFCAWSTCAAPIVTSTGKRSTTRTSPCGRRSICRVFPSSPTLSIWSKN